MGAAALAVSLAILSSSPLPPQAIAVREGDVVPAEGVFLTLQKAAEISQAHARCLSERDLFEKRLVQTNAESNLGPILVALLVGLAGGVLVGAQVAK